MGIVAIIPTATPHLIRSILVNIASQTRPPRQVIVINNTDKVLADLPDFRDVTIVTPPQPLGVNASWNLGIKMARLIKPDLVSILNDDLVLNSRFFEGIEKATTEAAEGIVYCPYTVSDPLKLAEQGSVSGYSWMRRREGWAMTCKAQALWDMPPISSRLRTFCGDDWIWHFTRGKWVKMELNCVAHLGSQTVKRFGSNQFLKVEKHIFIEEISKYA
jgi:glycosyltransferase involved in cell wall biosynthesis